MTAVQHVVVAVERHDGPPHWRVFYRVPDAADSKVHCHAFPIETLLWRAAEYGIDPADASTLLDVVLHEPHMVGHDHISPDFLYNTHQEAARLALHGRVAEVRTRIEIADPDRHLDVIRTAHTVDPEDLLRKQKLVAHTREHGRVPNRPVGNVD